MQIINNIKLYTYEETAKIMNVPVQTVYNYARKKSLKVTPLHGKKFVSEAALIRYLTGMYKTEIKASALHGCAVLTSEWERRRTELAEFCRAEWTRRRILDHMTQEYIETTEPITTRLYSLDVQNRQLVYRFMESIGAGLAELTI